VMAAATPTWQKPSAPELEKTSLPWQNHTYSSPYLMVSLSFTPDVEQQTSPSIQPPLPPSLPIFRVEK